MEALQGHLIAGSSPPFLVDMFRGIPSRKAIADAGFRGDFVFFLSHFHSDHYAGLSRHWKRGPVWCSSETGNLIETILGVRPHLVFRLPVGQPVKVHGIHVTLLDANHCPGSVMFLFEGPGVGRSLHCGDFRYTPAMLHTLNPSPPISQSLNNMKAERLDRVYLDTTYAESTASFPPQQEVLNIAQQLASKAIKEAGAEGSVRFLVGTYTIGKERIALHLARTLGLRIFVVKEKRRVFGCLHFPPEDEALFTEKPEDARIDLVPMNVCGSTFPPRGNFRAIRRHLQSLGLPDTTSAVAFVATGWALGAKKTTLREGNHTVHLLPYSEHSSRDELHEFVASLSPKEVIPTVCEGGSKGYLRVFRLFNSKAVPPSPVSAKLQMKEAEPAKQDTKTKDQEGHKETQTTRFRCKRQTHITAFFSRAKLRKTNEAAILLSD